LQTTAAARRLAKLLYSSIRRNYEGRPIIGLCRSRAHHTRDFGPKWSDRHVGVLLASVIHADTLAVGDDADERYRSNAISGSGFEPAFLAMKTRSLVYGLWFLVPRSPHDVVPRLSGGVVLAPDRVAVDIGGRSYRRVAEARGDGREVHAVGQQEARMAVSQDVQRRALGQARAIDLAHPVCTEGREDLIRTEPGWHSPSPRRYALLQILEPVEHHVDLRGWRRGLIQ
jgi:hypothetical protein